MRRTLEELHNAIAPFAIWQIQNLAAIYERYVPILSAVCANQSSAFDCRLLDDNVMVIRRYLDETQKSKSMAAYNRAAAELSWDIETLIKIVKR